MLLPNGAQHKDEKKDHSRKQPMDGAIAEDWTNWKGMSCHSELTTLEAASFKFL